jgi:ABC-type dipeptide/oligopeptide/nickel transport system ATPase component
MFGVPGIEIVHSEQIKHISPYLPSGHIVACILGTTGCGKSYAMSQLLPGFAKVSQIIICSKVAMEANDMYRAVAAYCEKKEIEFGFFNDPANACEGIQHMCDEKPPDEWGIIIFDDFSDQKSSRSDPFNVTMNNVSAIMRNYKYHSMYITQAPTNVPTLVRNNVCVRILFHVNNKTNLRSIREDFITVGACADEDEFDQLYKIILETSEHSYLMAVTKGSDKRLFIYTPGEKPDVPRLVVREDLGIDDNLDKAREMIESDPYLIELRDKLGFCTGDSRVSYEFRRRVKQTIRKHADYIAEMMHIKKIDALHLISDMIRIDLS